MKMQVGYREWQYWGWERPSTWHVDKPDCSKKGQQRLPWQASLPGRQIRSPRDQGIYWFFSLPQSKREGLSAISSKYLSITTPDPAQKCIDIALMTIRLCNSMDIFLAMSIAAHYTWEILQRDLSRKKRTALLASYLVRRADNCIFLWEAFMTCRLVGIPGRTKPQWKGSIYSHSPRYRLTRQGETAIHFFLWLMSKQV